MKVSPLSLGTIHFVGIGGIGMSGIAEILYSLGQKVQGSDVSENANVERLRAKGIPIFIGHSSQNIEKADLLVVSSAIHSGNPEVMTAKEKGISIVHRAEMLAQLARLKFSAMVAGSHGKTTTTSLLARIFDAAFMDPTVINGGIITAYGTNARLGHGDWMVIESDESDGSFLDLSPTVAVVTNIDPEHLDHYGDFDNLKEAFRTFLKKLPFYGFGVVCWDHPDVREVVQSLPNKNFITYGFHEEANVQATNVHVKEGKTYFDVHIRLPKKPEVVWQNVNLSLYGNHNVLNALAALTVAHKLEIPGVLIQDALSSFEGVKRRFTKTGEVEGISVYDDYAHHPEEIKAVLQAAQSMSQGKGRIIAVVQPHRYTRLSNLMKEFAHALEKADKVYIAPIYSAGESPIEGVTHKVLAESIKNVSSVVTFEKPEELESLLVPHLASQDVVLFMGAGTVSQWAYAFPSKIKAYHNAKDEGLLLAEKAVG